MRYWKRLTALFALLLVGGCAHSYQPQQASVAPAGTKVVAQRTAPIPCSTTNIGIANVSNCGSGFSVLSASAE